MIASMSVEELSEKLASNPGSLLLLDVREDDERTAARIVPSMHIPMNDVPDRLAELPRDRQIVVYCHHGSRSAMVAGFLESQGFADVANLDGGIDSWSLRVDPRVARY